MNNIHKCFISFKKEDEAYKLKIQEQLGKDYYIDKSLNERINSEDHDYVMQVLRRDYISDSTVTIVLIGNYSSEALGEHEQYYIKHEIMASLYNGDGNTRNGILGVVLPEVHDKVFRGQYRCWRCGCIHTQVDVGSTTVKEFSYNYYLPNPKGVCSWAEDDRYCVLVSYADFMSDPGTWIDKAFLKRNVKELVDKVRVRV